MRIKIVLFTLLITSVTFTLKAQEKSAESFLERELPGGPENKAADVQTDQQNKSLTLHYNGAPIFESKFASLPEITSVVNGQEIIEQRIQFLFKEETMVSAIVYGSQEAMAAETRGIAQENFALVRTSHGLSNICATMQYTTVILIG